MTMPMASSPLSRPGIAGRALGALFAVLALACFGFSSPTPPRRQA